MEDNDLTAQFNELNTLAQGILASVQTELEVTLPRQMKIFSAN